MAGMERFDFDAELVRRKIPSFTEEMLEEDLATLRMLMEIKNEVRALPREQQRELAGDLIEEISGEEFPSGDAMLHEVNSRIEAHERTPSRLMTLDEIQPRIRERKSRG